jgi:hypothetical protein
MKGFIAKMKRACLRLFSICLLISSSTAMIHADNLEPIAYIGHGAFFDRQGQQIVITADFVAKTQQWYRTALLAKIPAERRAAFASFEKKLNASVKGDGQSGLVIQQRLLEWLAENLSDEKGNDRIRGKLNALGYELNWKLAERADASTLPSGEVFQLDPELVAKLKLPEFSPGGIKVLSATMNLGQAYINECSAAGVPIPPPIGQLDPAGLTGWKTQGFIPTNQQFIVGTPAEVRTFQSTAPVGMCIALPRYTNTAKTDVKLDGVICMGQQSSKVCFWDNQMQRVGFQFAAGTKIPIGLPNLAINAAGKYQAGGFELENGSGGVCTDCHAGENPYIIHPNANLDPGGTNLLMGDMGKPPLNLPTFAVNRYDPLVAASWPQNQLSQSQVLVPSACTGCHRQGGSGGRFPHLSSELVDPIDGGYCLTILPQAINKTMPPPPPATNPGSQANTQAVIDFRNWCNSAPSAGPSNRGDPHLITTNNIAYDFQAAGEFTSLRNSDSGFELQTRQTPVSTTFVPDANSYTGLASCVSLNTAVAMRVGKHRITYEPGPGGFTSVERLQLRVDGKLVNLAAAGINLGNGNLLAKAAAAGGLDVTATDGTHVTISPIFWASQGYWYLDVEVLNTPAREGTMGTVLPANWLPLAPDGSSFGPKPVTLADRHLLLNQKFADAWRVTKTTSLFDYFPGTSTADFTDSNWPAAPGSVRACKSPIAPGHPVKRGNPELARRECSVIKDKAAFESCVFDVTVMGDTGAVKAYEQTLKLRKKAGP